MNSEDTFYLGAYWGDRQENLEVCTERLTACLSQLYNCDEVFQQWFEKGYSRKQALKRKVSIEPEVLRKLLDKGRNRADIGSHIIEDLGFGISLWNGMPEDNGEMSIGVCCGLYAGHPGLLNRFVVNLPEEGMVAKRVLNPEVLEKVIVAVVGAWEPDWAIITPRSLRDLFEVSPRTPYFSWFLFLSQKRGVVPPLPLPSRTISLEGIGTIIVITDERFDTARKEHLKIVKKVYKILKKSGLLTPIP